MTSSGLTALLDGEAGPPRSVAAGAGLFRRGDAAIGPYRVDAGRVRLVRDSPTGQRLVLHRAGPGELVAEAAIFADAYMCDAIAETDSTVRLIPADAIRRRLDRDAAFARSFAEAMARQVQDLRTRAEILTLRPATERILVYLGLRAVDGTARLPGTLKAAAEEIGLTHEAFYRALAVLARDGRIRREGSAVTLVRSPPGGDPHAG